MTYYQQNRKWSKAKKQVVGDVQYDSKFEAGYAQELILRQAAGEIEKFESHVQMPLVVFGYHICNYYVDFKVYYPDGTIEYVETKGYPTEVWRLKWKLFEALMSKEENVKLLVVQQNPIWRIPKARKIKK